MSSLVRPWGLIIAMNSSLKQGASSRRASASNVMDLLRSARASLDSGSAAYVSDGERRGDANKPATSWDDRSSLAYDY